MQKYTYYRRYKPRQKRSSFRPFLFFVIFLVVFALLLRACVSVFSGISEAKRDDAILTVERGEVEVKLFGQDTFEKASNAQIILEGDTVRTLDGALLSLKFHNGTEIRLDESSELFFSEVRIEDLNEYILVNLENGRLWLEQIPAEHGAFEIMIETDLMDVLSMAGKSLITNNDDEESAYVLDGQIAIDFVARFSENRVIEQLILAEANKSILDSGAQRALLNRENVDLTQAIGDELVEDEFVLWNLGEVLAEIEEEPELVVEEEPVEEEEEIVIVEEEELEEAVEPVEAVENLKISVSSPVSPAFIEKDAIAIEGSVISGVAERVTVEWSGTGEEYALGLFEAGSGDFRYVADVEYANFALGENIYTIRAYDENGAISNVLKIVITADF